MQYRYSLGYSPDLLNQLLVGNTFANPADWDVGATWAIAAGEADFLGTAWDTLRNVHAIFTSGHRYRIIINIKQQDADTFLQVYCGGFSATKFDFKCNVDQIVCDMLCMGYTDLTIAAQAVPLHISTLEISSIEVYELFWNDPLNDQPKSNSIKKYQKSDILKGLYVTHIEESIFWGDGDDYIRNIAMNDYTQDIPVRIEVNNQGTWQDYFIGLIYPSECTFHRNEVICNIEDSVISKLIRKKFDYNFWTISYGTDTLFDKPVQRTWLHNINNGLYEANAVLWNGFADVLYNVYDTLREMVHNASGLEVDVHCDFLEDAAQFKYLAIGKGLNVFSNSVFPYTQQDIGVKISIRDLIHEIDCLFNIGIIGSIISGIPTLTIKKMVDLRDSTASFTLTNIKNGEFEITPLNLFTTVKGGYVYTSLQTDKSDNATYFVTDAKISEGQLDVCSQYIQDSHLIYNAYASASDGNKDNIFWVECEDIAGSFYSKQFFDGSLWLYNDNIKDTDNFTRQVETLIFEYYNSSLTTLKYAPGAKLLKRTFPFECILTLAQLAIIEANPQRKIIITGFENLPESYIDELEFNGDTLLAKFKVVAT